MEKPAVFDALLGGIPREYRGLHHENSSVVISREASIRIFKGGTPGSMLLACLPWADNTQ